MSIHKVAVVGSSGTLGSYVIPALLAANFEVTLIIRPGGSGFNSPDGKPRRRKEAAYDDIPALTEAFTGQDAVALIYNPAGIAHTRSMVRAALAAGVKHLLTNEFGMNTFNEHVHGLPTNAAKIEAQRVLEEELANAKGSSMTWTGIFTGVWYDFAIRHKFFWADPVAQRVTRFVSGDQKVSIALGSINGDGVVAVLRDPAKYANKPAYFHHHAISANELLEIFREIEPEKEWRAEDKGDAAQLMKEGLRLWEEDRKNDVKDFMHTKAFVSINVAAFFDESNRYGVSYEGVAEKGFEQSREALKENLARLVKELREKREEGEGSLTSW